MDSLAPASCSAEGFVAGTVSCAVPGLETSGKQVGVRDDGYPRGDAPTHAPPDPLRASERFRHGVAEGGAWTVEAAAHDQKLRGSRYRLALVEAKWNCLRQITAATRALEPAPMNKR